MLQNVRRLKHGCTVMPFKHDEYLAGQATKSGAYEQAIRLLEDGL
jgi:hypothetical protein